MLWTDAQIVTTDDLVAVDPEVDDVARSIDNMQVDGINGIAQRAWEESGQKIIAQMQRFGGFFSGSLVSGNHLAAVFNVGGPGVNRSRIQLDQIVAFDPAIPAVKTWLVYETLVRFFHAAFARVTTNDRYEKKMREYKEEVRYKYWPRLKDLGLPIVFRPLVCPGATNARAFYSSAMARDTWSVDKNLTIISSPGAAGYDMQIAITWVDQSFYKTPVDKLNGESYHSPILSTTTGADQTVTIDITSLKPPTSDIDPALLPLAVVTSLNATGWNVYVGTAGGPLYLQNGSPIPIATKTYTIPNAPMTTGYTTDNGQYPEAYFTMQDTLQRG